MECFYEIMKITFCKNTSEVNPFPLRLFLVTLYLTTDQIYRKGPLFSEKENFKIMKILSNCAK